jgi:GT2 family glycosyltransferase
MIGIIIVNYKTVDQTVNYIQQELSKITTDFKIVIVNVACDDETNIALTKRLGACFVENINTAIDKEHNVFLLADSENLGYARGNNLGAAFFRKHFDMDYYLISNNDIRFVNDDIVEHLIETANSNDQIAAIGPKVLGLDGVDQSPNKYVSIWRRYIFGGIFTPVTSVFPVLARYFTPYDISKKSQFTYWVDGCFFIIKTKAFWQVQGFDPNTFLYVEEKILAERLLIKGYKIFYLPSMCVVHTNGLVINKYFDSRKKMVINFWANMYYYKRYRNVKPLAIVLACAIYLPYIYLVFPICKFLESILININDIKRKTKMP